MKLVIDTGAFIALHDHDDRYHEAARRFYDALTPRDRCLTTNYVVDETITRLRYRRGHREAVAYAETILKSRFISIVYVDAELEAASLAVLKRFHDHRLSFTDCVTIALAKARRVDAVFAFDDDFRKVGLRTIPDPR